MKSIIKSIVCGLVLCTLHAHGQTKITDHIYKLEANQKPEKASIADFTDMIGYWKGEGLGGICEELWMPEAGGMLHGSFRMATKGKLTFTEFMTVQIDTAGIAKLKVKHFSPDFKGWEEKDKAEEFVYLKKDANSIYFNGMTYVFEGEGRLTIYVNFKDKQGKYGEQKFSLSKIDL